MIANLVEYFRPEQEIYLDSIIYKRIDVTNDNEIRDIALTCQDNVKASVNENGVKVILTRNLVFSPEMMFNLSISFGANLRFNERRSEHDWTKINIAEELIKNGDFITAPLMSRVSLLIGQITSSYGQQPLMLNPFLVKSELRPN